MAGYNITDLNTALGAYTKEHSADVFRKKIYNPRGVGNQSPLIWTDILAPVFLEDEESFQRLDLDLQVRQAAATVAHQSDDAIKLSGEFRKVYDAQTIFKFSPYTLENTAVSHYYRASRKDREMPVLGDVEFVPALFDYIVQSWMDKYTRISLIKGNYKANFAYGADTAAEASGDSWWGATDGLLTKVTDQITASKITNVVATTALTSSNAFDKLEAVGRAIPSHLEYEEMFMLVSRQVHDWYNADRAATYPGQNVQLHPTYFQRTLMDRPQVTMIPVPEFGTSHRVIITTRDNIELLADYRKGGPQMKYMPINTEEIEVNIRYSGGLSFRRYDELVVSDQA